MEEAPGIVSPAIRALLENRTLQFCWICWINNTLAVSPFLSLLCLYISYTPLFCALFNTYLSMSCHSISPFISMDVFREKSFWMKTSQWQTIHTHQLLWRHWHSVIITALLWWHHQFYSSRSFSIFESDPMNVWLSLLSWKGIQACTARDYGNMYADADWVISVGMNCNNYNDPFNNKFSGEWRLFLTKSTVVHMDFCVSTSTFLSKVLHVAKYKMVELLIISMETLKVHLHWVVVETKTCSRKIKKVQKTHNYVTPIQGHV